jgi:hypothetical protein
MRAAAGCALLAAAWLMAPGYVAAQTPPEIAYPALPQLPFLNAAPQEPDQPYFDLDAWLTQHEDDPLVPRVDWHWQLLPDGVLYRAYLAGPKESRFGTQVFHSQGAGTLFDSTLGGHMGLLRFGTDDPSWPQGWQLDVEGSAQVRLDPDQDLDLTSVDYRVGSPLTYGYGRHRLKLGYYHLCSHLGDEFVEANPGARHLNFVRDAITLGYAYYLTENLRAYGEMGWAFYSDVSQPWEFQFGLDYAPARATGLLGAPFFGVHGHLREELDFSGNFSLQAGWAWRGDRSSHLLRTGLHYYNGLSSQYSFFRTFEQQIGAGIWYDY